jgi:hypothetical protein
MFRRRWYPGNRFIPAELGLDAPTRCAVLKAAGDRWMLETRNGVGVLLWMVGVGIVCVVALAVLRPFLKSVGLAPVSGVIVYLLMFSLWPLYLLWQQRSGLPQCIYAELRDRGHDVCRQCGYLRNSLDGADPCPECGTPSAPLPVH